MNDKTVDRYKDFCADQRADLYSLVAASFAITAMLFIGGGYSTAVWAIPSVALLIVALAVWRRVYTPERAYTRATRTLRSITTTAAVSAAFAPFLVLGLAGGGNIPAEEPWLARAGFIAVVAFVAGGYAITLRCWHTRTLRSLGEID